MPLCPRCCVLFALNCLSLSTLPVLLWQPSFSLHFLLLSHSLLALCSSQHNSFTFSLPFWLRVPMQDCPLPRSIGSTPSSWVPAWFTGMQFADIKWGSEANCCQIKDVPRQGKSCKIPAFSWWLFRVTEAFLTNFFGTLVWSRGKSRSRRNSKRRLCQSVHTSCKSLSFFQVHV